MPMPATRATRRTMACGPVSGSCSKRFSRASSISLIEEVRFAPDSPLEGGGFEPSVPRAMDGDLGRQVPALIAVFELAEALAEVLGMKAQRSMSSSGSHETLRWRDSNPRSPGYRWGSVHL